MYFFPAPHEDEILYSVLARYCAQSGHNNWASNFEDIFSSKAIIASLELPGNIDRISSNLPINSKFSPDYFVFKNTIFPYVASFLPEDRAAEVKNLMRTGNASAVYTKSGYVSGYIKKNRCFKFCQECLKEDVQNFGEAYWHRLHQITEVYVCPKHKVPLKQSNITMRGTSRQSFIAATPNINGIDVKFSYKDDAFEKLLWIAENVQILINRQFQFQNVEYHKNIYMEELINNGFASLSTMVHQKKLRKSILEFWGKEVLELLQCPVYADKKCIWLCSVVRKNERATQPIRNLILIGFLGIDLNKLLNRDLIEKDHKKIWEDKLIELANKKTSLRQIALELNSTTPKVKEHIKKLNIKSYWKDNGGRIYPSGYKGTQEFIYRQEMSRAKWLQFKKNNPKFSMGKLQESNETLYTWLRRNDNEWLLDNSPEIRNHYHSNWEERDKELLPKVKEVVESMLNGKPERISWIIVATKLDKLTLLTNYKDKLTLVKGYVESEIETLEKFHLRKLAWAVEELKRENKPITKSNLMIKAGVKSRYIKNIYVEVSKMLKRKGCDEDLLL